MKKDETSYYTVNPTLEGTNSKERIFHHKAIEEERFTMYDSKANKKNVDKLLKKSINLLIDNDIEMQKKFIDMTKPERVLFLYIINKLLPNLDYIFINRKECMEMYNYNSYSGLSTAINKFIEWEFLFKGVQKNKYWINTKLLYRGDLVKMWLTANNYVVDNTGKMYYTGLSINKAVDKALRYINYLKTEDIWQVHLSVNDLQTYCGIFGYHKSVIDKLVKSNEIEVIDSEKSLYKILL